MLEFSTMVEVVGLVPSVCTILDISAKKSGSLTSIKDVVLPTGTSTDQFPFTSVSTTTTPPLLSVT